MKKIILCLLISSIPSLSFAAVSSYYEGQLSEVGYEAGRGLIKIDKTITEDGCTGVYVDLSNDAEKVAYSTALTARMANAKVKLRFETGTTKYYSYCKVFQLTIMP